MATPEVHLEAVITGVAPSVVVACECGWRGDLGYAPSLLDVLNAVGEHNTRTHLTNDNTHLRIGRR